MWIPKWYFEAQSRKMDDLERRVKRLELMLLEEGLTIEEIVNKKTDA